jgi:Tol biopolymer transport system component
MLKCVRTATSAAALTLIGVAMLPGGPGAAAQTGSMSATSAVPEQVVSDAETDVVAPALSFTGRYIAYVAIPRGQTPPRQELRRADLTSGRSELLNRSIDGGVASGNYSMPPVISANGSRVAFTTNATRLVPADTNGRFDGFVRDASTDTTLLTSVAFDGDVANGDSGMTSLSKNGRYAVFTSRGTDVVPGSTTPNSDVYRRDLRNHDTVQVTVRPNGAPSRGPGSITADVSADGNLVAFDSYDSDLAPADGADQETDLFIRNMTTGRTRWLSKDLPVGANPEGVVISPDGRWVSSRWADGSLHLTRVGTRVTSTVTTDGYALLGAFSSQLGRFVFVSDGVPYVRDLSTGASTAIITPDGGFATDVSVSGNGQFAAYDWFPDDGGPGLIFRVAL